MKYIIYLTTNLKSEINGHKRIYIGVHKTENPDIFDGYLGCGVYINQPSTYKYPKSAFQYAVKKYGVNAFKRTVLYIYDTAEEAYCLESKLVTMEFINLPYTYNMVIGGDLKDRYKPLYQFDLKGNLIKKWERSIEAYEFFGYPAERFDSPKRNKCLFLNCFWSTSESINIEEYSIIPLKTPTYLYDKNGKLISIFDSQADCAKYILYNTADLSRAIKNLTLIKNSYYISNKLLDEFKPKPRKQWINETYYVYNSSGEYLGKYIGKELMKVINLNSWNKINHIFTKYNNWYKDFYISLEKIEKVPQRRLKNGTPIDIYTKYGEYIETLSSCKEVREKYKVPSSKLKNIKLGDKYFNDYIFKYNSR